MRITDVWKAYWTQYANRQEAQYTHRQNPPVAGTAKPRSLLRDAATPPKSDVPTVAPPNKPAGMA